MYFSKSLHATFPAKSSNVSNTFIISFTIVYSLSSALHVTTLAHLFVVQIFNGGLSSRRRSVVFFCAPHHISIPSSCYKLPISVREQNAQAYIPVFRRVVSDLLVGSTNQNYWIINNTKPPKVCDKIVFYLFILYSHTVRFGFVCACVLLCRFVWLCAKLSASELWTVSRIRNRDVERSGDYIGGCVCVCANSTHA